MCGATQKPACRFFSFSRPLGRSPEVVVGAFSAPQPPLPPLCNTSARPFCRITLRVSLPLFVLGEHTESVSCCLLHITSAFRIRPTYIDMYIPTPPHLTTQRRSPLLLLRVYMWQKRTNAAETAGVSADGDGGVLQGRGGDAGCLRRADGLGGDPGGQRGYQHVLRAVPRQRGRSNVRTAHCIRGAYVCSIGVQTYIGYARTACLLYVPTPRVSLSFMFVGCICAYSRTPPRPLGFYAVSKHRGSPVRE